MGNNTEAETLLVLCTNLAPRVSYNYSEVINCSQDSSLNQKKSLNQVSD